MRCTSARWPAGNCGLIWRAARRVPGRTRPPLAAQQPGVPAAPPHEWRPAAGRADRPPGPGRAVSSARGIGAATARRLAADGMAVAVLDLDAQTCAATVDAITADGGRAFAVGADV